jgi:hypothetical protein
VMLSGPRFRQGGRQEQQPQEGEHQAHADPSFFIVEQPPGRCPRRAKVLKKLAAHWRLLGPVTSDRGATPMDSKNTTARAGRTRRGRQRSAHEALTCCPSRPAYRRCGSGCTRCTCPAPTSSR